MLECVAPSPLHTMNRAVAIAEWQGAAAALELLQTRSPPLWLEGSYLWDAVLADLHGRAGDAQRFVDHRTRALATAPTEAVRALLERRLTAVGSPRDVV